MYNWYKNIFHMIAVLIFFLAASGGERNLIKKISKQNINKTETRQIQDSVTVSNEISSKVKTP